MHIEFEATFLQIDKEEICQRLKNAGAELVYPEFLMKRTVFNPPVQIDGAWMRVRQEADKITMSLKVVSGNKIEDQKEVMLEVNDFDEAVLFLNSIGAQQKAYQETKRELWRLGEVECTIDTWPGLYPFLEVEGATEEAVQQAVAQLGLSYADAKFCEVSFIYEHELGIPAQIMKDDMPIITFENPPQPYAG